MFATEQDEGKKRFVFGAIKKFLLLLPSYFVEHDSTILLTFIHQQSQA